MPFSVAVFGDDTLAQAHTAALRERGVQVQHRSVLNPLAVDLCLIAIDVVEHTPEALEPVQEALVRAVETRRPVVVLSQVPPGWMDRVVNTLFPESPRPLVFYQVDTIIVDRALDRVLHPEQFIIGRRGRTSLPVVYQQYLGLFGYPNVPTIIGDYSTAEFAKLAINYMLAAQIKAANELSDAADLVDADWSLVERALRQDKRIGQDAYIRPGSTNQHLDRDTNTLLRIVKGTHWWAA